MPSLEHLEAKNILNVMLNAMFGGRGIPGQPGRSMTNYLARLTDKTILAYESARAELTRYVERPTENFLSPLVRTMDQLETTVDSLWRASRFTGHLRTDPLAPTVDAERLLSDADAQRLRRMRNAIQHSDERVLTGEVE
jgi:hypothetical protein